MRISLNQIGLADRKGFFYRSQLICLLILSFIEKNIEKFSAFKSRIRTSNGLRGVPILSLTIKKEGEILINLA